MLKTLNTYEFLNQFFDKIWVYLPNQQGETTCDNTWFLTPNNFDHRSVCLTVNKHFKNSFEIVNVGSFSVDGSLDDFKTPDDFMEFLIDKILSFNDFMGSKITDRTLDAHLRVKKRKAILKSIKR